MKIKALLLCVLAALLLTGCQLARPEKENSTSDSLVGVFVTAEHLDLFDFEGYINDNLNSFSGGEIKADGSQEQYEGRLYASFEGSDSQEVSFGDISGIPFFTAEFLNDNGEPYTNSYNGDGLVDAKFGVFYGDDEDKITLEGTIYVIPDNDVQAHYINPVYQDADGKIYAKAGSGISVGGVQSQGSVMSQKLEETVTVTENGTSKKKTAIINIAIETMLAPQNIIIVQMDNNNNILKSTEYVPGKLPESINAEAGAAYIIVETRKTDFDGKQIAERKLASPEDTSISTFFKDKSNVLASQYTQLNW